MYSKDIVMEVHRVELVHLVLGAYQIEVNDRRFFCFPAPSYIPWLVFCGASVLAQHYRRALADPIGLKETLALRRSISDRG
jgi:hypothetical protein